MFGLLWTLSTALRGYLHLYLPSNRAVDWLRTPQGLSLAIPAALTMTPAYLFAASVCATVVDHGGPGYLNALVLLFFWNAVKFAVVGALTPHHVFRSLNPAASTHRAATFPDAVRRRPPTMHWV